MIKNIAALLKTYPKLSIVVFNLFLFFIMDFIGTKIYFSKNKKKLHAGIVLGKEAPVYHHGFIDYRKKGFSKNDIIKKFYIKNDVHFSRNGNQIIADEFLNSFF